MNEPEWERHHELPDAMAETDAIMMLGLMALTITAALLIGFAAGFGVRWWFWR